MKVLGNTTWKQGGAIVECLRCSIVELLYGAECSAYPEKNRILLKDLLNQLEITPFSVCIEEFCRQKPVLRRKGQMIEDNDLILPLRHLRWGFQ